MATIILSAVGTAVGGALGGPLGAVIGQGIGAALGGAVDTLALNALSSPPDFNREGPHLKDLQVQASTEGAPIPRIYGRVRIAGQIIWATRLEEEVHTESQGGGKGGGGATVTTTTYAYYANFAVGLCEGPVARIGRIWADGKPLDMEGVTWRFYPGSETQNPDSLIIAREGVDNAPAYRGLAYLVFERLPLEKFGNRIPQLTFEVIRPVDDTAEKVRAVNIIPGAGEFFCDPQVITQSEYAGQAINENSHAEEKRSDWTVSIDQLQATAKNLDAAALVVSWFGDDLRCGQCTIRPKVEVPAKTTTPEQWKVAGLTRNQAQTVSQHEGRPAYGGTPSDAAVIRALRDLHVRGLKPVLYPFVMMDIPAGNTLPDPYTGATGQPAFPWRGRITCHPAPGRPGSPDKSAALNAQLDAFIGTAQPSHFSLNGDEVVYSGPDEWSYRRFILHYAFLARAAGNVHAFLIGSELRGLTWLRDGPASYPFVAALKQLAADVKSILGPGVKVSYAADWSEWFGHHPQDGSNDVFFHLDPLWSDANIDFIGIDNYMPLADWRAGMEHADAAAGAKSVYDEDYLKANIAGGEYFDWYYASEADRDAQVRTPVTDGAHGKPWVFRAKDIVSWWSNRHYDRPGGVESATPTDWVPQSKPVWFTEAGCPALDRGANQPNVFFDPKSSESALPYHSSGRRDDAMQKAYLRAHLDYWRTTGAHNPVSSVYGGPMVDAARIFFWAWDARPYPWYPSHGDVWGDTASYELGHWLNGRLDGMSLQALLHAILADWDFPAARLEVEALGGQITGYVLDKPMSARAAIEPLAQAFSFDAVESGGKLAFRRRLRPVAATIEADDLLDAGEATPLFELTRAEDAEVPQALALRYLEEGADHRAAAVRMRLTEEGAVVAKSPREPETFVSLPAALPQGVAGGLAAALLRQRVAAREQLSLGLGPDHLALEPGDVVAFAPEPDGPARLWRIEHIAEEGLARRIVARSFDPLALEPPPWPARHRPVGIRRPLPAPELLLLDVPRLRDDQIAERPLIAAWSDPWPGGVAAKRADGAGDATLLEAPAVMGELLDALPAAAPWHWQRGAMVRVRLFRGTLASVTEEALFAGANAAAIGDPATGEWEILQFRDAELVGANIWKLSMFLRGQRGSEPELTTHPAGRRFVLLNGAIGQFAAAGVADIGQVLRLKAGPVARDEGDPTWRALDMLFSGRGLRPLSPVHVRRQKLSGGDWRFSWVRRSRVPEAADAWGVGEAPLAEAQERYQLQILTGFHIILRTIETTVPEAIWTAAEQVRDFPSGLPATVTVRLAQVSEVYGPGAVAQRTFTT